jgi:splicing factor 3B subunit 1
MATPSGFTMNAPEAQTTESLGIETIEMPGDLPDLRVGDKAFFEALMTEADPKTLTKAEANERLILECLLKIKNGLPIQRKFGLRLLTEKAREFGPKALFDKILPMLMTTSLEDQERHLLVKVIDRVLYKLDDLVRPFVRNILIVIEPLLIDEDYYARVEGREIISNLAKAAGLPTMIVNMRGDIDNPDEYVRNTTARAFSVVASALGVHAILPFLKAVCLSKKSWQARHTGIKIVQQIAILVGCAVLPHLKGLVDIVKHGVDDDQTKVRTITALALSALAEASAPYGIEAFQPVIVPLVEGIKKHRGKPLAAFLKAVGYLIPLTDPQRASELTGDVMPILIREFLSPDEEMKKIVLKVIKQSVATDGVAPAYVRKEIMPEFFRSLWVRRMALDRRNYRQLVDTTVELTKKVGAAEVVGIIIDGLKDDSEPFRTMVVETIERVVQELGVSELTKDLEARLMDGLIFSFFNQVSEENTTMLNGFGTIVNALGRRCRPYISQICGTLRYRLGTKSPLVRQQSADLIARIAPVLSECGEEKLLSQLGQYLYEYLGEEFPDALGSILGALKAIVNVVGMERMNPPIKDLLPRLTPILRNRHEKVQENCIDLVGRIADRGAEYVSSKEWMRISFELLELLRAHKKAIRRASVNTFGYIARAIGPQEVLITLLNNLRVQERNSRVCTCIAIAIVAETCGPYTVLPALMNEYRVPEQNVQNGVLKSLSFMFEYIGEVGKDYVYAITALLEDAFIDRDVYHRQIGAGVLKHMCLGSPGMDRQDAFLHLFNYLFPNIFEVSPHICTAVTEAVDAMRIAIGPTSVLLYLLQGLFHPARKVREVYWKLYNNLYIGSADALVAAYPMIEDTARNNYRRAELELFI